MHTGLDMLIYALTTESVKRVTGGAHFQTWKNHSHDEIYIYHLTTIKI